MSEKLYADRDVIAQGKTYVDHVLAMSEENLHGKAEIASELAHRDIVIKSLTASLEKCLLITKVTSANHGDSVRCIAGEFSGVKKIIENAEKALQKDQ